MVRPVDIAGRYNNTRRREPYSGSAHVRPHAPPIVNPRRLPGTDDPLLKYLQMEKELERRLPPKGIAPYTPAPSAPPELTGQDPPGGMGPLPPAEEWGTPGPPPPPTVMAPRPRQRPVGPNLSPYTNPGTGLEPKGWYPGVDWGAPLAPSQDDPIIRQPKYLESSFDPSMIQGIIQALMGRSI